MLIFVKQNTKNTNKTQKIQKKNKKNQPIFYNFIFINMSEYNINFIDVTWKPFYRRNNKSKYDKHLLCFPDHKNGIHKVFFLLFYYLEYWILWSIY